MIIYTGIHTEKKFNTQFIFAGVGLLFSFIGNYMHTLKPDYFAGLRLPWTVIVSIIAFFTICTIIVLIPCVYSYRLYKQQQ